MIVVFGSLNVDLLARVGNLPAPGETVLCEGYDIRAGGKGNNQAVAAAQYGAGVRMFGRVGDDPFGRMLTENLAAHGIDASGVAQCMAPTGCAMIAVDGNGENVIVVAAGANRAARAADVPDGTLNAAATVVVQMEVSAAENWRLLERARQAGARTVLNLAPASDLSPADAVRLAGLIDVLVLNRGESDTLAAALGMQGGGNDPVRLVRRLATGLGAVCVVTLGSAGAAAADRQGAWRVGALPVRAVDTTGAGDTFTGVLAAALDRGQILPDALHVASVAGGLACETLGAQEGMPTETAIVRRIRELEPPVSLP